MLVDFLAWYNGLITQCFSSFFAIPGLYKYGSAWTITKEKVHLLLVKNQQCWMTLIVYCFLLVVLAVGFLSKFCSAPWLCTLAADGWDWEISPSSVSFTKKWAFRAAQFGCQNIMWPRPLVQLMTALCNPAALPLLLFPPPPPTLLGGFSSLGLTGTSLVPRDIWGETAMNHA